MTYELGTVIKYRTETDKEILGMINEKHEHELEIYVHMIVIHTHTHTHTHTYTRVCVYACLTITPRGR